MANIEKYNKIFMELLNISNVEELENLKYQDVVTWDSVGHMAIIEEIETVFNIEMDVDDIVDFSSYKVGKEILSKYNIQF